MAGSRGAEVNLRGFLTSGCSVQKLGGLDARLLKGRDHGSSHDPARLTSAAGRRLLYGSESCGSEKGRRPDEGEGGTDPLPVSLDRVRFEHSYVEARGMIDRSLQKVKGKSLFPVSDLDDEADDAPHRQIIEPLNGPRLA